jgi:starch phosphorylase
VIFFVPAVIFQPYRQGSDPPICYLEGLSFLGMPFYIEPLREFLVRPALPEPLSRLTELAYNLLWSWEPIVRAAFRRLDPALWRECGYNPVLMLGRWRSALSGALSQRVRNL